MLDGAESLFEVDKDVAVTEEPQVEGPSEETGFAPEAPEQQVVDPPQGPPAEAPAHEGKNGQIPIDAYLTEREKRQKAEREAAELRQGLAQLRQRQAEEPLSIYDDPVAWEQQQAARLEAMQFQVTERISERFAIQAHGAEVLDAAKQWGIEAARNDPYFKARFMAQPDPFGWLIAEQTRDRLYSDFQRTGQVASPSLSQAAPVQPVVSRPAPPPRSIASQPSTGSGVADRPVTSALEAMTFKLG